MCILAELKAIFKIALKKEKKAVSQVPMMPHHQASSSLLLERLKET